MRQSVVLPGGSKLEYETRGHASGVPVLLLDDASEPAASLDALLAHLPATIRAICLRLSGTDEPDAPHADGTVNARLRDVREFMALFQIPAAVVVGYALGSSVARRLASNERRLVAGLVLIEPPRLPDDMNDVTLPTLRLWGASQAPHREAPLRCADEIVAFVYAPGQVSRADTRPTRRTEC